MTTLRQLVKDRRLYSVKDSNTVLEAARYMMEYNIGAVPVLRDGNIIKLPSMDLEVAVACSGIRSLMSLVTAAIFYGYFLEPSTKRRIILALAALPIAVIANGARIVGTGLAVQYWDPDKALGFFHEFSGWLIFVISLLCLYLLHTLMNVQARASRRRA